MWFFVYGKRKQVSARTTLPVAERTLRGLGFNVFDPARDGGFTVAGSIDALGVLVTVVALDANDGSINTINAFCSQQEGVETARAAAEKVYNDIVAILTL